MKRKRYCFKGVSMLPFFEIAGIRIPAFQSVLLFAVLVCGIVLVISPIYSVDYAVDICKKLAPVMIGAAAGARIVSALSLLLVDDSSFLHNLLCGGSVLYGGVSGGCAALAITCFVKKEPFLEYADVYATLLPLGQAIGRIGCYLNGCCYGCRYDGLLSVAYPVNGEMTRVFPTWFVESLFCLLLFLYFQLGCRTDIRGIRSSRYLILYSVFRFFIEFLRGDEIRGHAGILSVSQILSVPAVFTGIVIYLYSGKNNKKNYIINYGEKI